MVASANKSFIYSHLKAQEANMKAQHARFTGGTNSVLTVMLHTGKRGHNLKVSVRTPGEKTTTGLRSTVKEDAEAAAQFKALCADAVKRGWTPRAGRSTFAEMPAPPTAKSAKAAKSTRAATK